MNIQTIFFSYQVVSNNERFSQNLSSKYNTQYLKIAFSAAELRHNFLHSLGFGVMNGIMYEFQLGFVLELE
jgi:hypothetical protein